MALPVVEIFGKKVISLNGYKKREKLGSENVKIGSIVIQEMPRLQQPAVKNPDAVAFGYTAGRWMPAA
jgi:hypothetical protein